MNPVRKAHIALTLIALVNGAHYTIAKLLMPHFVLPSAIILIRGISASLFFLIINHFVTKSFFIERKDYLRLFFSALTGIAANQLFFFNGLHHTTPINAAVLTLMTPIMVTVISFLVLKTKLTITNIIGVSLGASGAFLLLSGKGFGMNSSTLFGDILIICNATCYGIFMVIATPLMRKYNPFTVLFWLFTLAIPIVMPFAWSDFNGIAWETFTGEAWFALGFVVLGATILAYSVNTWALKYIQPEVAGIYIYFIPMIASFFAVLLGKDIMTWEKLSFSLMIIGGVYLAGIRK